MFVVTRPRDHCSEEGHATAIFERAQFPRRNRLKAISNVKSWRTSFRGEDRVEDSTGTSPRRPTRLLAAVGALSLAVVGLTIAGPMSTAEAVVPCPPADIFVNTNVALLEYSPTGTLVSSHPTGTFFDIAFSSDGKTLYGVDQFGVLSTIDPATGAILSSTPITGLPSNNTPNALSAMADGTLLLGAFQTIYTLDPATGAAVPFAPFPAPYSSGGDFIVWSRPVRWRGLLRWTGWDPEVDRRAPRWPVYGCAPDDPDRKCRRLAPRCDVDTGSRLRALLPAAEGIGQGVVRRQ